MNILYATAGFMIVAGLIYLGNTPEGKRGSRTPDLVDWPEVDPIVSEPMEFATQPTDWGSSYLASDPFCKTCDDADPKCPIWQSFNEVPEHD
jgi:hypothetical protein